MSPKKPETLSEQDDVCSRLATFMEPVPLDEEQKGEVLKGEGEGDNAGATKTDDANAEDDAMFEHLFEGEEDERPAGVSEAGASAQEGFVVASVSGASSGCAEDPFGGHETCRMCVCVYWHGVGREATSRFSDLHVCVWV